MVKTMFDTFSEKKFLLKELVKRDLTSKYKDSVLGILWSFLNPLLIMLVRQPKGQCVQSNQMQTC